MNTLKINKNDVNLGNTFIALLCQVFDCAVKDVFTDSETLVNQTCLNSTGDVMGMVKIKGVWFDYFKESDDYTFIKSE